MSATELRRLAGKLNLLRAHIELEVIGERDAEQRAALETAIAMMVDAERVVVTAAGRAVIA